MFEKVLSKKIAMTLGELLIVFIIMGIVATMTIMSAKPGEKSLKYAYTQTYNVIGTAFYNSSINRPPSLVGDPNMDGSFPRNQKNLCLMLTEYINTSENRCASAGNTLNINANNINNSLNNTTPHFKASNGVWYWMASIDSKNFASIRLRDSKAPSTTQTVRYHVIVVDLNGSLGPNTTAWSLNRAADRVAFVVTEEADVIPLGAPEHDARYLTAKVVYNSTTGIEVEDQNTSRSMTYYEAKRNAWATGNGVPDIYRASDELLAYTFYQAGPGVESGDTVKQTSPFYLNYSATNANLSALATANPTHDSNCEVDGAFDPAACYVKITEYN